MASGGGTLDSAVSLPHPQGHGGSGEVKRQWGEWGGRREHSCDYFRLQFREVTATFWSLDHEQSFLDD